MKSPVIVSSNSDSGSSSEDLEVSLAIDQSHQMRLSDKGGASSSRPVHADQVKDNRCAAIESADGLDAERWNIIRNLSIKESEDHELEEQALPKFVEGVADGEEAIDHVLPARIPQAPGLSRDLFPGSSDDIASSSSYKTIERIRGDDDWSGVDIRIPRPHERPWSPPEGFLCLYECYFKHRGMWFPIPKLALEYCEARRVAPSQLTCASYRNICAILTMAAELGRLVNLAQLEEMVGIAKSGDCVRFYASMRKLQVLEPVPKGALSLIDELKKLGDYTIPLAKVGPYTHRPLKDRKKRSSEKQRSEAGSMGLEDLDVVVYNVGPVEGLKAIGGSEARRSEKRRDRVDDRRRSESAPKKSRKEKGKDKGLVISETANVERPNLEERDAEELVGDQTAVGATLSFGDDYDFNFRFAGRGRHILEDPVACGEYVRCIQGHPRGPVPEPDELVERDEFLAFSVDLTRKNHELIVENRVLKTRMKNMTIAAEEKVGHILALEQENEELKVEAAKWEDEVQSMMGEKQSIYQLAKSQMKRLRVSRSYTATNFGEYAIEKISSTVGQIKAFLPFYEEQGSAPEGAVERLQEDLEKYLKMVAAHDVEKISEEDLTFPDRASWIPDEELVFPIDTSTRIGQYGLGEEWDSSGEEEVQGGGEVDPRSSRVTIRVGGSDLTESSRGRERRNGSGSSHVSETDEDEGSLGVDDHAKNVEHPPEVAGAATKAAEGPSMAADPAGGPVVTSEVPEIDDVDVVNF
ncbi:hypothetical protein AALP_AA5G197100 [Arabis alpina]|uniref:DUF1204 domain-containing protein n=1 Tax=Arabis alpina TaxID=50452 RepID=A0A087GY67_ARAAL|nr:hypothetical protein AALP_AA5G197100 [Arabis alpina]